MIVAIERKAVRVMRAQNCDFYKACSILARRASRKRQAGARRAQSQKLAYLAYRERMERQGLI
jgi:hypothetical protein